MTQAQELLVDHSVIKTLAPEEKLRYLVCIKKTVQHTLAGRSGKMRVHTLVKSGGKPEVLQRFQVMFSQNVRGYTWKGIFISLVIFLLSFTFVFEESSKPKYDEDGCEIFNYVQENSYFIKIGSNYDLYLDGQYFSSYANDNEIEVDFRNLPIYEEGKNEEKGNHCIDSCLHFDNSFFGDCFCFYTSYIFGSFKWKQYNMRAKSG